jgi:flagellar biogenesis protein FliO
VLPLGEQRWVGILACDGRQFLLGATRQHLAVLAELDAVTDTWLVHEGRRTAGREPS